MSAEAPLVRLIDAAAAPLPLRDVYRDGDPGPIVRALAQVPELCRVALPFVGTSLGPGGVPLRLKEIAILRTSANLGCCFCIDAHTVVARDSGLDALEVAGLRGGAPAAELFGDATEQALVAWVDALSLGRGAVPHDVSETARSRLGDHRLVELTITVGTTMMLNRMATGLRLPTPEETTARLADLGHPPAAADGTQVTVEGRRS